MAKMKGEDAMLVKDGYKTLKQIPCQTLCEENEMESAKETMSKDEEQD